MGGAQSGEGVVALRVFHWKCGPEFMAVIFRETDMDYKMRYLDEGKGAESMSHTLSSEPVPQRANEFIDSEMSLINRDPCRGRRHEILQRTLERF